MVNFTVDIEIDEEFLKVLQDYESGYTLDSEYFEALDKQDIENEIIYRGGLLEGGFYQHYPLSPTEKGYMVLELIKNKKFSIK